MRLKNRMQLKIFDNELKSVQKGNKVEKCQVSSLHHVLDEQNVIRVGGRLKNSNISRDQRIHIIIQIYHVIKTLTSYFQLIIK